jgi:hypothetical protein
MSPGAAERERKTTDALTVHAAVCRHPYNHQFGVPDLVRLGQDFCFSCRTDARHNGCFAWTKHSVILVNVQIVTKLVFLCAELSSV